MTEIIRDVPVETPTGEIRTENKYRNTTRQKADEEKLKMLLEANTPKEPEVPASTFVEPTVAPEPVKNEAEVTWEKRYGDLRRFSQKEIDAREAKIRELERNLAQKQMQEFKPPKGPEEVAAWAEEFPDLYGMLRTVAHEENKEFIKNLQNEVTELRSALEAKETEVTQKEAFNTLLQMHPDFLELRATESFKGWIAKQSKLIQDALFNSWDVDAAAAVIDMYKAKHQTAPEKRETHSNKDAASSVRTPATRAPVQNDTVWSESRLQSMSRVEKERTFPQWDKAIKEGKFEYDLSGPAR